VASPQFADGIYLSSSGDLAHVVFITEKDLLPEDNTLQNASETAHLYEVDRTEAPGGVLHLIGVDNHGAVLDPNCGVFLGSEVSSHQAIADGGAQIAFSAHVNVAAGPGKCLENPANPTQVFVRLAHAKTLELSRPLSEPCAEVPCPGAASRPPAEFQGESRDGSAVFFTTTASLSPNDKDATKDLYEAELGCPAGHATCDAREREVRNLIMVSEGDATDGTRGAGAEVEGVTRIADDGSRVYFVARGKLTSSPSGTGSVALAGAENLYMFDTRTKETKFVAELCSGHEESGTVSGQLQCRGTESDVGLWEERDFHAAQATPDGRFLAFQSFGDLVSTGADATETEQTSVYRYDANTGAMARVSLGEEAYDANGAHSQFGSTIAAPTFGETELRYQEEMDTRAMTDDGSTIIFKTAERLSPRATPGQSAVYEWHNGQVRLLSGGGELGPSSQVVITPSGSDVIFTSAEELLPVANGHLVRIFDARIGGGIAEASPLSAQCAAMAECVAEPSPTSGPTPPATALAGGSDEMPPSSTGPPRHKRKARCRRAPHRYHRVCRAKSWHHAPRNAHKRTMRPRTVGR
jgi:hypothetical protein